MTDKKANDAIAHAYHDHYLEGHAAGYADALLGVSAFVAHFSEHSAPGYSHGYRQGQWAGHESKTEQ
jgi:hypothetical protein